VSVPNIFKGGKMNDFGIDENKVRIMILRRILEEESAGITKNICDDHLFHIEQKNLYDSVLFGTNDDEEMKNIIADLKVIQNVLQNCN